MFIIFPYVFMCKEHVTRINLNNILDAKDKLHDKVIIYILENLQASLYILFYPKS